MPLCFFASDLHGRLDCYDKLFAAVAREGPAAVFLGGDLLPSALLAWRAAARDADFLLDTIGDRLDTLRHEIAGDVPAVFAILGNDDPRLEESAALELEARGLWHYVHQRRVVWQDWTVYGYACVPPTPFRLKDWECYDVSRYVDPGCVSPEEGIRTLAVPKDEVRRRTIAHDLEELAGSESLERSLWLFHAPPYDTGLDRAALDGRAVDHVPLDVHVGSVAVRRFIEAHQPHLTMHGHIHESARLTGSWREQVGRTTALSAAHDGPELALVRFDPDYPERATRALI